MSISAFFHQETPLHPYFNTIPDSYHLSAPSRKDFSTHEVPPLSPQTVDQSQYSSLDPIVEDASTLISVTTPLVSSQPRRDQEDAQSSSAGVPSIPSPAPIPSLPQSSVEEESGYSSVIIPNTIDDFLATHQVLCPTNIFTVPQKIQTTKNIQAILLSGFESDFSLDFVELLCMQVAKWRFQRQNEGSASFSRNQTNVSTFSTP